jgi:hypothetical protein
VFTQRTVSPCLSLSLSLSLSSSPPTALEHGDGRIAALWFVQTYVPSPMEGLSGFRDESSSGTTNKAAHLHGAFQGFEPAKDGVESQLSYLLAMRL